MISVLESAILPHELGENSSQGKVFFWSRMVCFGLHNSDRKFRAHGQPCSIVDWAVVDLTGDGNEI